MIPSQIAEEVIGCGLGLGAEFVDIFVDKSSSRSIRILDSKVNELGGGIDFGIGIRLLFGTNVVYGHTNLADLDELIRITRLLAPLGRQQMSKESNVLANFKLNPQQAFINHHPAIKGINHAFPLEQKIAFMQGLDKFARNSSSQISQVDISLGERLQQVQIFNSQGLCTQDERNYIRLYTSCIAEKPGERATGSEIPGAMAGYEFIESLNAQEIGERIASQAITKLNADHCPAGKMPVILGNGFGGVIFHEACGHLLETTSVQKKASVFWDKMGEQIANPALSACDDGTIAGKWGSINIDDEGMPTQKTQLIKDGILTNFLVDYVGHLKTGHARSGSGRRQSYKFAPASRMRNTFIQPGSYSLEDLITSVDHGIYCKTLGGGSVQPGTGEFNFSADECYLIKNGKIGKALKTATLIGTGPDILKKISMVGNDLKYSAGVCGSVSGSVPVTVGQPSLKVDDILVGGQA